MIYPSRTPHNGDKGANMQQGPVLRFLFRLRPCVNLFSYYYHLLLFHTLLAHKMPWKDIDSTCELTIRRTKMDVIETSSSVL